MNAIEQNKELKSISYEIFILLLSLLSLFNLVFLVVPSPEGYLKEVVLAVDPFITLIFMADFLYRFFTAESKRHYFFHNFGWADLLSSFPAHYLNIFRIFRIGRAYRLFKHVGPRSLWHEIVYNRAGSALYLTIFLVIVVMEFGAMAILAIEGRAPGGNIQTASDALWWGYVTITTIGYGDYYPVSHWGRLVGMLLLTAGVGLFGVITGYLANAFGPASDRERGNVPVSDGLEQELAELRALLGQQIVANEQLQFKIDYLQETVEHLK